MTNRDDKLLDRRPNWNKWSLVPDVAIWEGAALSLDIEPDKVEHHPEGWMADAHLFKESQEFNDRIFVLTRNHELCRTMKAWVIPWTVEYVSPNSSPSGTRTARISYLAMKRAPIQPEGGLKHLKTINGG